MRAALSPRARGKSGLSNSVPAARAGCLTLCPRQDAGLSTVPGPCGDAGSAAGRSARSAYGCAWRRMPSLAAASQLASRPGEHRTPSTGRAACRPVWRTSASGRSDYEKLANHHVKCRGDPHVGGRFVALRIDPGSVMEPCSRERPARIPLTIRPECSAGADPPQLFPTCRVPAMAGRYWPRPQRGMRQGTAACHSERCCGMPASSARTSVSLYRRCPPSVRMEVSFPALAHRVTVFGSTRNIVATSAGVSSGSASGVRADMCTASPPGPVLRSCVLLRCLAPLGSLPWMSHMVYSETILPSPAVTSRPPGAKIL